MTGQGGSVASRPRRGSGGARIGQREFEAHGGAVGTAEGQRSGQGAGKARQHAEAEPVAAGVSTGHPGEGASPSLESGGSTSLWTGQNRQGGVELPHSEAELPNQARLPGPALPIEEVEPNLLPLEAPAPEAVWRWGWSLALAASAVVLLFVAVRDVPQLQAREERYAQTFGGHLQPRFWLQGVIAEK